MFLEELVCATCEQRNVDYKQFDELFWLPDENPDIGKTCDEIRDVPESFHKEAM